jgi:hypothetical protein
MPQKRRRYRLFGQEAAGARPFGESDAFAERPV